MKNSPNEYWCYSRERLYMSHFPCGLTKSLLFVTWNHSGVSVRLAFLSVCFLSSPKHCWQIFYSTFSSCRAAQSLVCFNAAKWGPWMTPVGPWVDQRIHECFNNNNFVLHSNASFQRRFLWRPPLWMGACRLFICVEVKITCFKVFLAASMLHAIFLF